MAMYSILLNVYRMVSWLCCKTGISLVSKIENNLLCDFWLADWLSDPEWL